MKAAQAPINKTSFMLFMNTAIHVPVQGAKKKKKKDIG